MLFTKRTTADHPDFIALIKQLDHELWDELKEDQATYNPFNLVADVKTAVIIYDDETPVAIGCYKKYNSDTVEIKRMFVQKPHRGKGISKMVLHELEQWAIENGFKNAVLETSIFFEVAKKLYRQAGYAVIPNYDQYKGLKDSVCMKKILS
jgi:GNAT superfamily N-acetyltransferase